MDAQALTAPLEPEELAEMNVEDLIKENLEILGKKLEIMIGVTYLDGDRKSV